MKESEENGLLNNLKVLYVEDEDFARGELSIFLKRRVGKLYTACNGREGFELFKEHNPDIVLTDLKMPEMGGIELIEEIRKFGSNCPVIVITALSDSETIIKTVDLGIVKYAIKPLNTKELIEHMEATALDILKIRRGETVAGGAALIERDRRKEIEKKLKSEIAFFLKTYTGKGPRDVQVFIKGNAIEVKAFEVLTLIEANLIGSGKNCGLVNYNRKLFYEEKASELESKLEEAAGFKVRLAVIEPDSEKNCDNIVINIL